MIKHILTLNLNNAMNGSGDKNYENKIEYTEVNFTCNHSKY